MANTVYTLYEITEGDNTTDEGKYVEHIAL
jgi:hypothetical protein